MLSASLLYFLVPVIIDKTADAEIRSLNLTEAICVAIMSPFPHAD